MAKKKYVVPEGIGVKEPIDAVKAALRSERQVEKTDENRSS